MGHQCWRAFVSGGGASLLRSEMFGELGSGSARLTELYSISIRNRVESGNIQTILGL